ncbi:MAG TPA: glycoside hydrolase family 18 protein [Terriglobales bacterium]|nr:glycoside hydrolase family 18 protein [Terriglobales bacterium]
MRSYWGWHSLNISLVATLLILAGSLPIPAHAQASSNGSKPGLTKRVVGDYGYWSKYQTPAYGAKQIPYKKLTHINHYGVSFGSDASLYVPDGFLEPALIRKAHKAGLKVLLGLGGDFWALDGHPVLVATLVGNLWDFISQNGYDGVDIDWEYPTADETDTFYGLMQALRNTLTSPTYVISADVPPWGGDGSGYAIPQVDPLLDYFNIMMYDCAGPWTEDGQLNSEIFWDANDPDPWECQPGGAANEAIAIFLQEGVAPQQLNMGTPFYGYFYTNVSQLWGECANSSNTKDGMCDASVRSVNYGTFIKPRINNRGWVTFYDEVALVPYMLRKGGKPGFITYDDPYSTYYRVWHSDWQEGLGGTFMWSLDADYDGQSQDLLDQMYAASLNRQN